MLDSFWMKIVHIPTNSIEIKIIVGLIKKYVISGSLPLQRFKLQEMLQESILEMNCETSNLLPYFRVKEKVYI